MFFYTHKKRKNVRKKKKEVENEEVLIKKNEIQWLLLPLDKSLLHCIQKPKLYHFKNVFFWINRLYHSSMILINKFMNMINKPVSKQSKLTDVPIFKLSKVSCDPK